MGILDNALKTITNKIQEINKTGIIKLPGIAGEAQEKVVDFFAPESIGSREQILRGKGMPADLALKQAKEDYWKEVATDAALGMVGGLRKVGIGITEKAIKPLNTPLIKLLDTIKQSKTVRGEIEKLYTAERAKRAKEVETILKRESGEKGFIEALGALKGKLIPEKPKFEPLIGEGKLNQEEVDNLFSQINQHETFDVFEKVSTYDGLKKVFNGEIPPPKQLSLLEDVFGSDLTKSIMDKRPVLVKIKDLTTEILNLPRSLIASFDMSAPLRQGIIFTLTKPISASKAGREMFRQTFSPENFKQWFVTLKEMPEYKLMKDSGLYISEPLKLAGGLSAKEERFMTNIAQQIPIIGKVVRASERAYTSYLNKLRVDVFNNIAKNFIKSGLNPETDIQIFKSLAEFINNATGRGDLGSFSRVSQELNTIFFSPRLIASRFNMLNPVWYLRQAPQVRKEAIKSFAEFIGVGSTILSLAKMAGAEVEVDPRSTDFGKIKVGDIRWDIWGGFQQWTRFFTQVATGQRKTTTTKEVLPLSKKKFPFETRLNVAERFLRGKLAPVPGLLLELAEGQKLFGEEITLSQEALENTIPLYLQDIGNAIQQIGPKAIFEVGIPGFFGIGVQTYKEKLPTKENRFNQFNF